MPLVAGSAARVAATASSRRPSRSRSSGDSCASYGMPSPPPASTSRSLNPAVAASRGSQPRGRLDVGADRRRVEQVRRPEGVHANGLETGRGDGLRGCEAGGPRRPCRTSPRRRRRPGAPVRDGRSRSRRPGAARPASRPMPSAIAASRRSSPTGLHRHGAHAPHRRRRPAPRPACRGR